MVESVGTAIGSSVLAEAVRYRGSPLRGEPRKESVAI
jgi:hypothetical protein